MRKHIITMNWIDLLKMEFLTGEQASEWVTWGNEIPFPVASKRNCTCCHNFVHPSLSKLYTQKYRAPRITLSAKLRWLKETSDSWFEGLCFANFSLQDSLGHCVGERNNTALNQGQETTVHGPNPAYHLFCKKKEKYWDTATLIYLRIICVVHGCSHAKTAEMSDCERDHMVYKAKNIYYWPFIKKGGVGL